MGFMEAIDPWEIEPLHEPRNKRHLRELVSSMRKDGWVGRPLLCIECADGIVAWTGSHRIEAARVACLSAIPCYVMPESCIATDDVDARTGHVMDYERLKAVVHTGDEDAIRIMWQEGRE